jgi:CHAT domain-containing protein
MDEQRFQACVNLIEQLLGCASGEEMAVLQRHSELVDAALLPVMQHYAEHLDSQGNRKAAQWLLGLTGQLAEAMGIADAEIEGTPEDSEQFLLAVLQLVADSREDTQQVYPFLAQHQEKLNEQLLQVLPQVVAPYLVGEPEQQQAIAALLVSFDKLISQYPLGLRWLNLELGISASTLALEVYAREAFPQDWAMTQNNLAIAYSHRIRGERADNLEKAITASTLALQVYTREAFPQQWAATQNNLANAYRDRILGERADNLEQAIAAYTLALQVRTRKAFPQEWAMTQNNLANAYSLRIRGERADNLEKAIAAYTLALQVYTREAFPQEWAMTQNNLALAYSLRIQGERADNLEQAIAASTLTLQVYTREAFPQQWAMTQNNLANAYSDRILEERADNLEQAIAAYTLALQVYTREAFPQEWAATQNNLANAYSDLTEIRLEKILDVWFDAYNQSHASHKAWLDAMDQGTRQLWQPLMAPLIDRLKQCNFQQATLILTGLFSLLPLHAAWTEAPTAPTGRHYALDAINFTYAPNARSLSTAQEIAQRTVADSILAIDNPLNDLPNSTREVTAAVATFPHHKVLQNEHAAIEAVLAALPHYNVLHLSCHSTANSIEPLTSGLAMSDGLLTLRDLLDLKLDGIRLAILSACETGLAGIELADEAISLPTGLLQAGVAGVAASLWSVSDLSTMMLLTRFYDFWRIEGLEIDQALRQAQQWVRDTTNGEKVAYFKKVISEQSAKQLPADTANFLYKALILKPSNARDFAHPFHWAAFQYVGV